jgi:hypothetical protein
MRTLLLGEYMNERLLLRLPHRQFAFTVPKVLRVFFRHDKSVHGQISRLIYRLVRDFSTAAAGCRCPRSGNARLRELVRGNSRDLAVAGLGGGSRGVTHGRPTSTKGKVSCSAS